MDNELMDQALKIFQVRAESGNWGALSAEQEMVVAMQAKFDAIKDVRLKLDLRSKKKKAKGDGDKKFKKKTRDNDAYYEWKNTNPNNMQTMKKFRKEYHWCKYHNQGQGMWVLHKPENCKNKAADEASGGSSPDSSNAMVNRAVAEIQDSDSDEESE